MVALYQDSVGSIHGYDSSFLPQTIVAVTQRTLKTIHVKEDFSLA